MANDCLQTKLKSVVNNDNLEYLNKIKAKVVANTAGDVKTINIGYNILPSPLPKLKIISGTATFPGGTQEIEIRTTGFSTTISCPDTNDNILLIEYPENITSIRSVQGFNADRLLTICPLMTVLQIGSPNIPEYVQFTSLTNLTDSIIYFQIGKSSKGYFRGGSLNDLLYCKELRRISISDSKNINGDVSVLSELYLLDQVLMKGQMLTGSVNDLAAGFVAARAAAKAQDSSINLPANCRVEFSENNVTYKVNNVDTPVPFTLYIIFDESEPTGYRISTSA